MLSTALWRDIVAPSPGRLARALEVTVVCAIVVLIAMTFQIPDPAISAYLVFFVAKEDSGRSILLSMIAAVAPTLWTGPDRLPSVRPSPPATPSSWRNSR